MRIALLGTSRILPALKGLLEHEGYRVVERAQGESYTVTVHDTPAELITVDTPDALFGRVVTHAIAGLAPKGGVFVAQQGGNQDDRAVLLRVPPDDGAAQAVERGMIRALALVQQIVGQAVRTKALTAGTAAPGELGGVLPQLLATWDEMNHALITEAALGRTAAAAHHEAMVAAMSTEARRCDDAILRATARLEQAIHHTAVRAAADTDRLIAHLEAYRDRRRWWQWWR